MSLVPPRCGAPLSNGLRCKQITYATSGRCHYHRRSPDDLPAKPAGYIECPECHQHIPVTTGELTQDDNGNLTVPIDSDDVWAHYFSHEEQP